MLSRRLSSLAEFSLLIQQRRQHSGWRSPPISAGDHDRVPLAGPPDRHPRRPHRDAPAPRRASARGEVPLARALRRCCAGRARQPGTDCPPTNTLPRCRGPSGRSVSWSRDDGGVVEHRFQECAGGSVGCVAQAFRRTLGPRTAKTHSVTVRSTMSGAPWGRTGSAPWHPALAAVSVRAGRALYVKPLRRCWSREVGRPPADPRE